MSDDALQLRLIDELRRRQFACGGVNRTSTQAATEASCLAALAVRSLPVVEPTAQEFLLGIQNLNGSWPAFDGDDHEGSWTTSLAKIALLNCVSGIPKRVRGVNWLLQYAGKESSWFWNGNSGLQIDTFASIQTDTPCRGSRRQSTGLSRLASHCWL